MHTKQKTTTQHWWHWLEPWYIAYGLLGVCVAGMLPILLPLDISNYGSAVQVSLALAVYNLSGLSSPVWGMLADRFRLHRWLLAGGLAVAAASLAAFSFAQNLWLLALLGFVVNTGATSAGTVANLFVVEQHPQSEWDARIGWLQTCYGIGQVVGLFAAGAVNQSDLRTGLLVGAACCAVGAAVGWFTTKDPTPQPKQRPTVLSPQRHSEVVVSAPQTSYHFLTRKALQGVVAKLQTPFGLWLVCWLFITTGSGTFFALYPVLMREAFMIQPNISSLCYGVAAALSLTLYTPAGNWAQRFGPVVVQFLGNSARLVAFLGLWLLTLWSGTNSWFVLVLLAIAIIAWSLIAVSSSTLTAMLSPTSEGEGTGIFNSVSAIGNVVGALLGGIIAGRLGYTVVPLVATILLGIGCALMLGLWRKHKRTPNQDSANQPAHAQTNTSNA